MQETAYAKINLALHIRKRREDGYHELETLFAFVDGGDTLLAKRAEQDSLQVVGEFGAFLGSPLPEGEGSGVGAPAFHNRDGASPPPNLPPQGGRSSGANIVMQALGALPRPDGLAITLEKNLPVAAGLGGGSADAGALFRLVERAHGLPDDWRTRAAKLGADVPACVESVTCVGRGTGTELDPIASDLSGTPVLLVNPRVPLATGPVFKAWDGQDRGPMPEGSAREIAEQGRNDLRDPAISLCPVIAEVLAALGKSDSWKVEVSGSGATCFALFDSIEARDAAARALPSDWWQMAGRLR
ncbi:4-(cytidine 5'-diphospho)-2-C-methyl-D-erythritol kinase [Aurantiacibacter xanthus]|uniref:4-diphosphocytidyl-2-C-methyl-D-erythritol kinase n=1 Tax=Aurantiacibacter xanthus TaxID=1784712 RepID=A0A3A1P7H9_9SPHN|nr:4-(cytidine 5'-diphospho)-2-C-methyl-D-erythritol kinase [Aurantiacibacter xanthus]RIV89565.1 4-(cytidine 5'-diphospho)-2-C-methyl-D-erythritol kinase [Aurantiacibacter xanthus]